MKKLHSKKKSERPPSGTFIIHLAIPIVIPIVIQTELLIPIVRLKKQLYKLPKV